MPIKRKLTAILFVMTTLTGGVAAQVKKPPVIKKKPIPTVTVSPHTLEPETPPETPKKNQRPGGSSGIVSQTPVQYSPNYYYKFERPGFLYPTILIEHDEHGNGKITFTKDGFEEKISDPIALSPITLDGIKTALKTLNFLDSTENYQFARDFSNMGNVTITLRKDGRERIAKYNWTENKDAKFLMDEYRRIGNEYVWKFEITIARENQPLESPRSMETLDSYIKRNEISDPPHLVPFLTELSNDERLPLIARNHATRLLALIQKNQK